LHPLAEPAEPDAPPVAPLWAVPRPEEAAAVAAAVAAAAAVVVPRAPEVVAVAGMAASPSAQREAVAVGAAMVAPRAPEAAAGTEARRADARHPRGAGCRRDRLHHDRQDRDRWAAVPRWGPGQASAMTPVVVPAVAAEEEEVVVVVAATRCAPVRLNVPARCDLHRADRTRPADHCSAWRQAASMAECQTRPEAWRRGASWMARHRVA
jgi:hypothetical protein